MQDYVSRFEMMAQKCKSDGMKEMEEEYKGGLLMTHANLEERDLSILKAALGGEVNYERVKLSLLNIFGNKEQKNI